MVYDIEISPGDQEPPWENVERIIDVKPPNDWFHRMIGRGVRFYTYSSPLIKGEPLKFGFKVQPKITDHIEINSIKVHLSDENGKNLGEIEKIKRKKDDSVRT